MVVKSQFSNDYFDIKHLVALCSSVFIYSIHSWKKIYNKITKLIFLAYWVALKKKQNCSQEKSVIRKKYGKGVQSNLIINPVNRVLYAAKVLEGVVVYIEEYQKQHAARVNFKGFPSFMLDSLLSLFLIFVLLVISILFLTFLFC